MWRATNLSSLHKTKTRHNLFRGLVCYFEKCEASEASRAADFAVGKIINILSTFDFFVYSTIKL